VTTTEVEKYQRAPTVAQADRTGLATALKRLWETEPGIKGWLSTVDYKEIGLRYIVTAFAFLIAGGVEALIFRLQLAGPNLRLLTPEQYDQLFTMHGMTMIFLYAGPVLSGFSNYLWPLILGARDMALPRLNMLSYWIYLCAGIFMYAAFLVGFGPNDGWFNYVPYAARAYNGGPNIDFYALGIILLGLSTTVGSINFVVTFLRLRVQDGSRTHRARRIRRGCFFCARSLAGTLRRN
jgi:heme/copper-type cytochrome/quinol oxidase subunit 1